MFTRSRYGRRASPARLNVEHLEDRFLPHGSPFAAALVGPVPVGPAHADARPDHPGHDGTVLGRPEAAQQGHQAESHGPGPDQGHGKAHSSDKDSQGQPTPPSDWGGGSTSGPSSPAPSGSSTVLGRSANKGHDKANDGQAASADTDDNATGAKAKKGHDTSDDDSPTSDNSGRATAAGHTQATASVVALTTARSAVTDEGEGAPGAAGKRAADVGPVGPLPTATATSDADGTSQSPARPAAPATATATAVPVVPVRLAEQSAAGQDGGDEGGPDAAPAGEAPGGSEMVLAGPDQRAAALAAHGQAGAADDGFVAPLSADIQMVRDGVLAEGAAPDAADPAAAPAAYAAFAVGASPAAIVLLDRLALDTRALDAALQGFLRGLDRLGEQLSDPRMRLGVSAWLLGGAAALAVLEVNRRRRAAAADGDGVPLTWLDPEGPAPEPAS